MGMLTVRDAAKRMGVKVETLYAYVSRGLIESHPGVDGRTTLFDERAVETLARRGRPRQSSRSTSLNMLIETSITSLSTQGLRYRGLLAHELTTSHTFEDVALLLWTGDLGNRVHGWSGTNLTPLAEPADLHDAIRISAARVASCNNRTGSSGDPLAHPGRDEIVNAGRQLIATITGSLPVVGDGRTPRLVLPDGSPPIRATIAGQLWSRLSPQRPAPGMLAVLNAAMILMADHELAASTLAVRVAASTRADPAAVVSTGLGVLSGSLHGRASRLARHLIDDALMVGPIRATTNALAGGARIAGFGHSVYVEADPRAVVLLDLLRHAVGHGRVMAVVDELQATVFDRIGRPPNVDLALAAMSVVAKMPDDGGEAVMSIARIAGWLAHAQEEYGEAPLRFRPRASYVGPTH